MMKYEMEKKILETLLSVFRNTIMLGKTLTGNELLGELTDSVNKGLREIELVNDNPVPGGKIEKAMEFINANMKMIRTADVSEEFYRGWLSAHTACLRSLGSLLEDE